MRRRNLNFLSILLVIVLAYFITGCPASMQDSWKKLSSDEKARIILGDLQDQLESLWTNGKAYVDLNPQYLVVWKVQIVPLFDKANKTLRASQEMAKLGGSNSDEIFLNVQPAIEAVIKALKSIGLKLPGNP